MFRLRTLSAPAIGAMLALTTAPAHAQRAAANSGDSISAPISDVRYDVSFTKTTAASRQIEVTMSFTTPGTAPVLLSLPAWTPGAYEMTWFAKWISDFMPSGENKTLQWDKVDYDTWRIRPAGEKRISVHFRYTADTLDNAMAWTRPDFALFNGTNLFLYPEGRGADWPATVTVRTEVGWLVASGMTAAAAPNGGINGSAAAFSARNYHDLVDMPFFVGAFDLDSAKIQNVWMRFASYPKGSVAGDARKEVWEQLTKVLPPEIAVFRAAPFQSYTVMQIADSSYGGASGLEHQNSHVDIISPFAIGNAFMPSLYAHEIFHAWNVKRLRPAEMVPYRYDRTQPTPWLWVSEGITDYYADLAQVRGGVIDSTGFLDLTSGKINEVNAAVPVALEDASVSTWVHPTDGTGYLYYPKGSLAGLMLDIMIRDASDNRRSLDDVMRELYETTYKKGTGFTSVQWWAAVSRAAGGKSFTDFNARYIDDRYPYPWATVLPLAGFQFVSDSVREPRLGVFTAADSNGGVRVTSLSDGGAAMQAGVRAGDVLVSVGDISVVDASFGEKFRARYGAAAEGAPLAIVVKRGGQNVTLNSALRFTVRSQSRVAIDAKASAKAARIRAGILHGTTGK